MKRYIQKASNYMMVGGLGAILVMGLSGCGERNDESGVFKEASQKQGAFVVIEEVSPNNYKIAEEYPSSTTRVILRDLEGNERILSKEELDALVAKEAKKIEANQSPLVNPQIHSGGMSLGETILASAAGAIIGSWIGSRLFNNPTYQNQRQRSYKSPTVFQRSQNSFNKKRTKTLSKKSGFFSNKSKTTTKKSYFSFGG